MVDDGFTIEVLNIEYVKILFGQRSHSESVFAGPIFEPDIKPGPIEGLLELYVEESAFRPGKILFPREVNLKPAQRARAYKALIQYANTDPNMARFRPGQPPETRFSFILLGQSIIRLMAIAAVSILPVFGVNWVYQMKRSIHRARKRNKGLCIFCGYPSTGLLSPICPECGNNHSQFY